jgi:hypothetical protein
LLGCLLQNQNVHSEVGNGTFDMLILLLHFLEPLRLADLQTAVLMMLPVVSLLDNPYPHADIPLGLAVSQLHFSLPQMIDDLCR